MTPPTVLLPVLLVFASVAPPRAQSPASSCSEWRACRDMAEQARATGEYETFHDLAWRTIQTRGRRDPDLLFLLARAQSLSGRPHDALVTLRRLAQELRVAKDISADDDFRRVRALPGWPETQAAIAAAAASAAPPERSRTGSEPPRELSTKPAPEPSSELAGEPSSDPAWREVARFQVPAFTAGGLAYDAVSRRFVIGNLPSRKLTIVEEGTNRAATLSGDAARLLDVRAIEIDRRRGDLWVVSEGSRGGSPELISELHKLQLISGRVLTVYTGTSASDRPRFADVAIGRSTGVLVLDAEGPRVLRPSPDGHTLSRVINLPAGTVTSLAPDDGRTVYVAYDDRVVRVDLATQRIESVAGNRRTLAGFKRLRWYKGSLVGVQNSDGAPRIVQVQLSRAGAAVSVRVLDAAERTADIGAAVDLLEDEFYYLVAGAPEAAIRRIRLK